MNKKAIVHVVLEHALLGICEKDPIDARVRGVYINRCDAGKAASRIKYNDPNSGYVCVLEQQVLGLGSSIDSPYFQINKKHRIES